MRQEAHAEHHHVREACPGGVRKPLVLDGRRTKCASLDNLTTRKRGGEAEPDPQRHEYDSDGNLPRQQA